MAAIAKKNAIAAKAAMAAHNIQGITTAQAAIDIADIAANARSWCHHGWIFQPGSDAFAGGMLACVSSHTSSDPSYSISAATAKGCRWALGAA